MRFLIDRLAKLEADGVVPEPPVADGRKRQLRTAETVTPFKDPWWTGAQYRNTCDRSGRRYSVAYNYRSLDA